MVFSISRASTVFLLFSSAFSFTPCPLLGPAFPPWTLDTSDKTIASALEALTRELDMLVSTNTGSHGDVSPNTTFSIALSSADSGSAQDEPFFWQYHHIAPALSRSAAGSRVADENSIYRIGGLTEVFTVWCLLLSGGDHLLNDPVTKYLPELANGTSTQDDIEHVLWDDVTVGRRSSHMSGLARDYCSTNFTLQMSPAKASFPPRHEPPKPCCGDGIKCDSSEFIQYLANQPLVAPPSVTQSYSNMAFHLLGYIIERIAGKPFSDVLQQYVFDVLGMTQTTMFAPLDSSNGIIPIKSLFTTITDLSIAGQAILNSTLLTKSRTNRWLRPVSHTSNPANSLGIPWVIYSGGSYPNTSMVDVYTVLSNEGVNGGLYSSYLGLVHDFGVGFAILSADTETPAELNAHADIIEDVVLEALMVTAPEQAAQNFGREYQASGINSSITVAYDELPGLCINEFVSNGTDFRAILAALLGISKPKGLSIRLYPTQLIDDSGPGSRQAFRAVFQDITELADNGTPTCVSWMDVDKLTYGGRGLDEFVFALNASGDAVGVQIPALQVDLWRETNDLEKRVY
ncbi:serine hydrolase domain-containing protein [Aspergillus mulundensis]|uniref:Beta-lactamase-like protein n=1 Tax=Aspergillus mulundensis TaxID=1810919 RepID=A0A3D8RL58_9EURO|nr:Beta-lactamase-like protein [Aspergillus mulundensis]RDW74644.1 Beta-lactamase-like protein [Aspergillus mulundensis]